ncbi:MFS transporter [Rhizobium sp. BK251]|uniref:MFS transporter n=1 Tax=Rhizobium sp. BK251 TaxID=2512125 RepID=UPI00104C66C8|nr:MFS transporter [Rhizobium sp. BK251]TCL69845.1 putative MFS family arabinose efflux permease [Rhizobium sp. BK251]
MSSFIHDHADTPTSGLEHDARMIHATDPIAPGRIAIGVVIARMTEFFDFFVYGIASVLVFPHLFFAASDPLTGMLYSFAVFSVAFIARPFGSVLFMSVDRQFGRAAKLTAALFTLGGSTIAISFLPSYADAGLLAPILLIVFRIGQGLGLGGSWDGLASLLALNAPEKHRGWYAMIPQLGAPIGFMLASGLFIVFVHSLTQEEFLEWGWRFPFFVAFALNVVALFARLRLLMTSEFGSLLDRHELQPRPVGEMLRVHGRDVLAGVFVPLASFALFHLMTVFPLGWVTLFSDQEVAWFLSVQFTGALVAIATVVLSGILADRLGRRTLLGIAAILIAIFSFVAPHLLAAGPTGRYTYVLVGFALLGLSFGQAAGALASRFSLTYRYTASAVTSDIAWLIGAGFAPLVALSLSSAFGIAFAGYYLLSGAVCTLIALAFSKRLEITNE